MEAHNADSQHAAAAATETEVELSVNDVEVVVSADEEKFENEGGGDQIQGAVAVSVVASAGEAVFLAKRKRGRPRKQQPVEAAGQQFMPVPAYSPTPEKRGRGRPRGSGKWQTMAASLGGVNAADSAGSNFTPHTITVQPGENLVQRIWSFSQSIPDSICILSACGMISVAEVFMPASRGGVLKYEGQFTIIHLNGSHTYDETRGGKICLLSVQLVNSDGRFYGGAVANLLIAAGPIQLIIGTFRQKLRHQPNIRPQRFASPNPTREAIAAVPSQSTDQKPKATDAKGKGALVIDPPVAHDDPPVTDEVAMEKGKAPDRRGAAPQPSSAPEATSDDDDADADGAGDEE